MCVAPGRRKYDKKVFLEKKNRDKNVARFHRFSYLIYSLFEIWEKLKSR